MPHLSLLGLPEAQVMRELEDLHSPNCMGNNVLHKIQGKVCLAHAGSLHHLATHAPTSVPKTASAMLNDHVQGPYNWRDSTK